MNSPDPSNSQFHADLDAALDRQNDEMVSLRRLLHRQPEVSGAEFETSRLLKDRLDSFNCVSTRLGPEGRGVIADIGDPGDPVFAIRGDIDALRIQDEKEVSYRSERPGVMHACGHDAHTAMIFGTVAAFAELYRSSSLPASFRLRAIFQPAEETCEGAKEMIEAGAVEGVRALIAAHVDPNYPVGTVIVCPGVMTAHCDHLRIAVRGQGGHAARPHQTRDPIAAAANLIQSLYSQVPRSVDSQNPIVLTIGQILGGQNGNVIPDVVSMHGTLRTLDLGTRESAQQSVHRIANAVAAATQTKVEVEIIGGANAVNNCPNLTGLIESATRKFANDVALETMKRPSMGGEDFAFYGEHVIASMFRLGIVSDTCGGVGLHKPQFDLDEQALRVGAGVFGHTALEWHANCGEPSRDNQDTARAG